MTDANDLLKQGIAALKAGQKAEARRLLGQVVQQDKDNETAWLWLSGAVDTDRERTYCLREILHINPNNEHARRGLEILESKAPVPRPAQPVERKPTQPPPIREEKKHDIRPIRAVEKPPPDDTKQCPYCAEKIKAEAKFCRFCGRNLETGELPRQLQAQPEQSKIVVQQAAPPRKKRNPVITCLAALGFIVVVFICLGLLISPSPTTEPMPTATFTPVPTKIPRGSEYSAIVACRDAIREQLLVPKSAEFDGFWEPPIVKEYKGDVWDIWGKVEASNAFGVMLPYQYYCRLQYQAERYTVLVTDLF